MKPLLHTPPVEDFEALYLQYRGSVRRTLYWMVGPSAVDDLTQEVFVKVWSRLQGFRGASGVGTWIHRITINTAYDHLRGRKWVPLQGDWPAVSRDVALGRTLEQAVHELTPTHRAVFVLFYKEQLTEKEIGASLGVPLGTVKSRLHHARTQVRQFLEKQGIELGRDA